MTNRIVSFLRDIATGTGINGAPWSVNRHIDDVTIASGSTSGTGAAAGKSVVSRAALGNPGPVYLTQTTGGQTKIDSGMVINQVGPYWLDDIPTTLAVLGRGIFSGITVTATGLSMSVSVSAGSGIMKDGLPFIVESAVTVGPLAASHATLERYDRIVIRTQRRGTAEEGKIEFVILQGVNAAVGTALAPLLTNSATVDEFSLAKVLVSPAVTTIAANKVTEERHSATVNQVRPFLWPETSGTVQEADLLSLNSQQNVVGIHAGTDGQVLTLTGGYPSWTANAIFSVTSSPSITYPGAGPGATSSIAGSDRVGEITVTTGGSTGSGDICWVAFRVSKPNTNFGVVISPRSNNAASDLTKVKIGKTPDGFLLTAVSALNTSATYIWDYQVDQWS